MEGLADSFPRNVPRVLVAPRDFSLPTSSQSAARSPFLEKNKSVREGLVPSSSRSGVLAFDPELVEKSSFALSHLPTPSRVVGSLRMGVWVGVVGASDWGEGMEKHPVDDDGTFAVMGGARGALNLAMRRVSEAWWVNFMALSNPGARPIEEADPLLKGSAPELISELEAELSIALALLFLSNSIIPGKGNSFKSIYFDRSPAGCTGNGEPPDFDEGRGKGDAETGEEFDVREIGLLF